MARLAGTALVEIGLDVGFGQRQPRRATVDDRAERGPVAFPPSREAKNASEAVETHARAVLSMNSIRLPNGSSVKKRWRPSMRSEEHTSELQSLMRISYAVFCLKKKKNNIESIKQSNYRELHSHEILQLIINIYKQTY